MRQPERRANIRGEIRGLFVAFGTFGATSFRFYAPSAGTALSNFHADRGGPMHKRQQFSTFQSYLKDRERRIKRLVSAIEKRGVEGALDRCRLLVDQINRDLRGKKFGDFVNDVSSLADFQVSIERAASLLDGIAAYGENQRPVDAPNQQQAAA
jgi:hypothetical protein